jgi:hypothetical protein
MVLDLDKILETLVARGFHVLLFFMLTRFAPVLVEFNPGELLVFQLVIVTHFTSLKLFKRILKPTQSPQGSSWNA